MKVLVTGGAGFIGSHLCHRMLSDGCEVSCIDNMHTGNMRNIMAHMIRKDFTLLLSDVVNPYQVDCDWIFNMACPASPVHYQSDPVKTIKTAFIGTLNALDLARRCGARMLQASTSEVYGDPEVHPQHERYNGSVNCTGPRACYDEGKRAAEALCFDYRRKYGVDVRVVRIFNTYGPNMQPDDGRVVSNFIMQALRGEPITIYGKGVQTRSFCFIDDLLSQLMAVMSLETFNGNHPVNVGDNTEITIDSLARSVIRLTGVDAGIRTLPMPVDDPFRRRPDLSVIRSLMGKTCHTPIDKGLDRTIAYFKRHISTRDPSAYVTDNTKRL